MASERIRISKSRGGFVTHRVTAYVGRSKVGYADLHAKMGRGAFVKDIHVNEAHRGKGIASRMLTAAAKAFKGSVTGSDFTKDGRALFRRQIGKGSERFNSMTGKRDGGWSGTRMFVVKAKRRGAAKATRSSKGGSTDNR